MEDRVFASFLEKSRKRLHALASESSVLNILGEQGDPPRRYLLGFDGVEHLAADLQRIKDEDVPAFNAQLRVAGLPEIYLPRPIS